MTITIDQLEFKPHHLAESAAALDNLEALMVREAKANPDIAKGHEALQSFTSMARDLKQAQVEFSNGWSISVLSAVPTVAHGSPLKLFYSDARVPTYEVLVSSPTESFGPFGYCSRELVNRLLTCAETGDMSAVVGDPTPR